MEPGQAEVELPGYHEYWFSAEKKGYSGTAVFARTGAPVRHLRHRAAVSLTGRAGPSLWNTRAFIWSMCIPPTPSRG